MASSVMVMAAGWRIAGLAGWLNENDCYYREIIKNTQDIIANETYYH
jgi:hypothetical protein